MKISEQTPRAHCPCTNMPFELTSKNVAIIPQEDGTFIVEILCGCGREKLQIPKVRIKKEQEKGKLITLPENR